MENTHWLTTFQLLSKNHQLIKKCLIKNFHDDRLRDLPIPSPENFSRTFSADHIKDVLLGGPLYYREIESLHFPAHWTIPRVMRNEILNPHKFSQDIENIHKILQPLNFLNLTLNQDHLIITNAQQPN